MHLSRDELALQYLEQLPYPPYPLQEEALLAWFSSEQGVLVCAPTGTGKTLIAQAALFEALHTKKTAYYTTPLIALTEQKFSEMQAAAVRWGFQAEEIGLVTGNRQVNPQARILVVVAEILLNRLLNPDSFDFSEVSAVVMDEFHSFADVERGIVWELSLGMLPAHVRLLLLSATVGNSMEFVHWLDRCHQRKIELVEGRERKVPLTYRWVPDQLLGELLMEMAEGTSVQRKMPALVFAFNRDECWSLAEQLKGLPLLDGATKTELHNRVNALEWRDGIGPKLKQMLHRGVGVHHAGLLPKYRRKVEDLFERKLLACVVCTETLGAGINLPARSVVLTSLVKGPFGKQKLIDSSTAQQIFGRAGRPQFDSEGFVYSVAHEDDVKLYRWKQKYDQIPEDTRDPNLIRAKKDLKRKKPDRRSNQTYWSEAQFLQLQAASPGKLYSKGPLPWRLLAYLLKLSPEVSRLRNVVRKRLLDESRIIAGEKQLVRMLTTLHRAGFVKLDPEPPMPLKPKEDAPKQESAIIDTSLSYQPEFAHPTIHLPMLLAFRSVNPIYGVFLMNYLGKASRVERLQIMESLLEMPKNLLRYVRVPLPDVMPPGPLQQLIDPDLVQKGLIKAPKLESDEEEEDEIRENPWERPPTLAEKMFLLFADFYPELSDVLIQPVWAAAEILEFGGNFSKFISHKDLAKQEGLIFRHLLRLILLCGEFAELCPTEMEYDAWQTELKEISESLTECCRRIDPDSTDEAVQNVRAQHSQFTKEAAVEGKVVPEVQK